MGRITLSFRMRFQREVRELKRFRNALMDAGRRNAFDSLLKSWSSEQGAMSYAHIPYALDAMLLTAVVDNRKRTLDLSGQVRNVNSKMSRIQDQFEKFLFARSN